MPTTVVPLPKIAIIDDLPDFAEMLGLLLDQHEFRTVTTSLRALVMDGAEGALRFLHEHEPDVVVLDVSPPHDIALRYLETFREGEAEKGRKFVLMTTMPDAVARHRSLPGVVGLVRKPAEARELVKAIVVAARGHFPEA